jgi:hypothetical protein
MRVAVQSCVLRTPPSCVFAERILLERMGKVKVSTNQLIMKGEEDLLAKQKPSHRKKKHVRRGICVQGLRNREQDSSNGRTVV